MTRIHDQMAEARRLGVPWREVVQVADDLKRGEQAYDLEGLRRRTAELLGVRGAWRAGLERVAAKLRNAGQDVTAIRYHDEIGAQLKSEFPEFGGLDACDVLELALSDQAPPTPCDRFAQALGWIEAHLSASYEPWREW